MTLDEIIKAVNDVSGIDITKKTRVQYVVICRYMYYKLASEFTFNSNNSIAKKINQRHCSMTFAMKKIDDDLKIPKFKRVYENILLKLGIKKDEEIEKSNINVLTLPNWISDSDVLEFKETRLKPYIKMLETRKKQKEIVEVAGAKINR